MALVVSENTSLLHTFPTGLISDVDYAVVDSLLSPMIILFSFCGIITNFLNVGTFAFMGVKDGVNLSFLFLSVADFCFAFLHFISGIGRFIWYLERERACLCCPISPMVFITFGHFTSPFASVTCVATSSIAVVRCACVVRPLQFKDTFSRTKTGLFLGGSTILFVGMNLHLMIGFRFVRGSDAGMNVSRLIIEETGNNQDLQTGIWIFANTIVPIVTQVIVMVCVPVLINALKAASSSRGQAKAAQGDSTAQTGKLDGKDAQVVAQVVFISVLFVICNFTVIVYCIAARVETEFYFGKLNNNLHNASQNLVILAILTSGILNVLVYLKYNSSYRRNFILRQMSSQ